MAIETRSQSRRTSTSTGRPEGEVHEDQPAITPEAVPEQEAEPSPLRERVHPEFDLFSAENICVRGNKFNPPEDLPLNFDMMFKKGGAAYCYDGFIFYCEDQKKDLEKHSYYCQDINCNVRLRLKGFSELETAPNKEHNHPPPEGIFQMMFKWHIRQIEPDQDSISQKTITNAMAHLSNNQKSISAQ